MLGDGRVQGYDLVMIGRQATGDRDFHTLLGDLRGALKQAGVTVPEKVADRDSVPASAPGAVP
jgi:ribonuclease P protein component